MIISIDVSVLAEHLVHYMGGLGGMVKSITSFIYIVLESESKSPNLIKSALDRGVGC